MKAARINRYKQAVPTIEEIPMPDIGEEDVLVKVLAASINPIDLKTKDGGLRMLLNYQIPLTLGSDFAGVIVQAGRHVQKFQPGDAVYGRVQKNRIGTFAEYLAVSQKDIAFKPKNLSFEEAAAIPLVGLTSYQALHDIMLIQPNQKVLIQAGSGGIGTIAIQIAKNLGAFVATTTSQKNTALVRSLGADLVIDYKTEDFTDLKDYDHVFDTQGGQTLADAFKIIKAGGNVVTISGLPTAQFAKEAGLPLWKRGLFAIASRRLTNLAKKRAASYTFLFMKPSGQQLQLLTEMIEQGQIKPIVDRIFPLAAIQEAFAYSKAGHARGKIILKIADEVEKTS